MQPIFPVPAAAERRCRAAGRFGCRPTCHGAPTAERRQFVFGLFDDIAKAEHARRKLRAARFEDRHLLLVGGAAGNGNGVTAVWNRLPAGTPFLSLAGILQRPNTSGPAPHDGLTPRLAHQISNTLDGSGAVLVVAIQTAEQERGAARTLLTSNATCCSPTRWPSAGSALASP